MTIPDYQTIMLPLLRFAGDGKVHSKREVIDTLAKEFQLSEAELKELLPSGNQEIFYNRVGWAESYLKKAGLVERPKRGCFMLTERGKKVLSEKPQRIDVKYLEQFPEFIAFRKIRREQGAVEDIEPPLADNKNPEETLEAAYLELRQSLISDIMDNIKRCPPGFFERLVIDVLIGMGYGGSRKEAGEAMGGTGDGGIDGIIKEDKLGLDIIYIQAKRWEGNVGRPEVQKFVGALQGQRAKKGIFITTSEFTKDAIEFVNRIDSKIILIDGPHLAELMIDHNVGVSPVASYEIKKLDSDYFIED
jgi:restriction system protein